MKPTDSGVNQRQLAIEVLRLRAGIQRQAWTHSACQVVSYLQPSTWLSQAQGRLGAAGLGWVDTGLGLLRRYPLVLSLLGSVAGTPSRRRLALKAALIAGLVWLGKRKATDTP